MCEQTELQYLDGDVVWVKLGPCWWPGEVQDLSKIPPEIVKDFKKQPIAVVKFFQEDQYEYVKNINHIYKYSCRKKNEFIKKGLDMHRAKIAFMDKFPADVCQAESLTGGDPDIITNDEFAPEQKPNYSGIFGTPSPKKTPKTTNRGRSSSGSTPKSLSPQRRITHPRFVGKSDHEVRILEQSTPTAPTSHYTCHICGFESTRLNVIVLHNRSHSNGTYVSPSKPKTKKVSKKNARKSFATTNSIDEDLELIRQGLTISTEETSESETDERDKRGNKRKNNKAANSGNKKAKVSSICNNLLADWGDSDEETENEKTDETEKLTKADESEKLTKTDENEKLTKTDESEKLLKTDETEKPKDEESEKDVETTEINKSLQNELLADGEVKKTDDEATKNSSDDKKTNAKASEKSSCFDFDDEEENTVLEKSPGRKIPRVIPSKRISKDAIDSEEKVEHMETETTENVQSDKEEKKESVEPDLAAFQNLLEETAVPDFTSIPDVNSKTKEKKSDDSSSGDQTNGVMKIKESEPDIVSETTDCETVNKEAELIAPKKRIVRNFEEFENLLNEQKNTDDEPTKSKSTLEVSKLKSQLMSKLNEPPVVGRIETPEPDSEIDSKTEDESQSSESFQKKTSQSESEDTDIEKKDSISKDLDSETPEEKSLESEKFHEIREESPEIIKLAAEPQKVEELVPEEVIEKTEDIPMEIEATVEPVIEEENMEKVDEEKMEEERIENIQEDKIEKFLDEKIENLCEEKIEKFPEEKIDNVDEMITKEVIAEGKMEEESIVEESAVEESVVKEFSVEDPAVEESAVEESAVEETVVEETAIEETAIEESVVEQSVMEETAAEESIVEVPDITENEIVEKIEQPVMEEELIREEIPQENPEKPQKFIEEMKIEEIPETQVAEENFQKNEETRSQKMLVDISDICIDNSDNLSGLSTLAAVSELTGNLYDKQETITQESTEPEAKEEISTIDEITNPPSSVTDDTESRDMTPVQEELSDTAPAKPVRTLANFSMDFSDSNSESTIIKTVVQEDVIPEKITDNMEILTTDSEESKIEICEPEKPATDITAEFETIESEIEKITSIETTSDKLNSFPENISQIPQDCASIETTEMSYSDFQLADTGTSIPGSDTTDFITNQTDVTTETTLESEIAKLTDTNPDAENVVHEQQSNTSSSKLLEILTDSKKNEQVSVGSSSPASRSIITSSGGQNVKMVISGDPKAMSKKFDPKTSKFVIKSASPKGSSSAKSNKPIILSEKIIKPVTESENVSVKKVTSKRTFQDVEDIDTFIIQKPSKKSNSVELDQQDIILTPKYEVTKYKPVIQRGGRGKPKILEQTIIKTADVVAATSESQNLLDDSMFDINSMPIVLSDQILTPESMENIPMVMTDLMPTSSVSTTGQTTVQTVIAEKPQQQTIAVKRGGAIQQVKLLNKGKVNTSQPEASPKYSQNQNMLVKNIMPRSLGKNQKVYQTGSKTLKHNPSIITQPGKPGKFIILPTSTTTTTGVSKYTVGKRLTTVKSSAAITTPTTSKQLKATQSATGEPTGNKIMIVTNQQGVQSRVLLTPAQQKLLGCKVPGTKMTKTSQIKSGVMQKSILTSKGTIIGSVNSPGIKTSLASQTIMTSKGQMVSPQPGQMLVTSEGQVLTPITQQQLKSNMHKAGQKIKIQSSRVILPEKSGDTPQKTKMNIMGTKSKTVLIKGAQGQTLKKIQASGSETKNLLLSQPGHKSQLVAIGGQQISGKQVLVNSKGQIIKSDKVGIPKQRIQSPKVSVGTQPRIMSKSSRTQVLLSPNTKQQISGTVPPLAPITAQAKKEVQTPPKQTEQKLLTTVTEKEKHAEVPTTPVDKTPAGEQKQPNQLIIQDAMGNQTTVTEGQILALPSGETVDGQPQSYVLVTVDESGNLVPISNDTLMSLDPSFAAGGDMNNIVLQIDPGAQENQAQEAKPAEGTLPATELPVEEQLVTTQQIVETEQQQLLVDNQQLILQDQNVLPAVTEAETQLITQEQEQQVLQEPESFVATTEETQVITSDAANLLQDTQQTAVACSINNGDSSQQLIITGDPESTQKFLASLTEGNTDLSSLLSGTDGNIIINTDGQQILLNTDSENQILLSVNSDMGLIQAENDPAQNAMYVTQQAIKNQDILAAALADTDVFQQESAEKHTSQALSKVSSSAQSQLSPNSSLYPMTVGNVLETSLTLGSPIMTPLEVPSVNSKKITTDVDLITQVPSSLELPITITDPSISQTVSNLELPISISDNVITSIRSSEMNSLVYSLPTLDDHSDLEQKRVFTETSTDNIYNTSLTGSMSMPLLTEEPEIQPVESVEQEQISKQISEQISEEDTVSKEEITVVSSAPETNTTETIISESDQSATFTSLSTENLQTVPEKISSELQMSIEEDLDLNSADICNSLSDPPPGMFEKSSFSNFLNKPEGEHDTDSPTEIATSTSETSVMNSLPILTDGADPETEAGSSDMLTSEKSTEESNLDMDYGVSESSDQQSISETVHRSELPETPNSELNSPRLDIDENSCEIPIQPPIVTNLSETFPDNAPHDDDSSKRVNEDEDDEHDAKRTKLSCD